MERDELAAWLRLTTTPGIGGVTARRLLAAFGLPQAVFEQPSSTLRQVVTPAQAWALLTPPPGLDDRIQVTWNWLQETPGGSDATADAPAAPMQRAVIALGDAAYPRALLELEDPPLLLYALGRIATAPGAAFPATRRSHGAGSSLTHLGEQAIAIVGSRNPTAQGAENARQFSRSLAQSGWTVVSGLALGIDAAAHEGALAGAPAPLELATVAVVGTGLDRVYPRQHLELARRIAHRGLLLSEYPLGTPPSPANFPRRNRLIAALSRGTLVVEAALRSGSLITARLAAEQGREVFAVPGSIHSSLSRGCHALIRQGAKLVESAQDILEELGPGSDSQPQSGAAAADASTPPAASPSGSAILDALGYDPIGLDALLARTGMDAATLQAQLLELELDGAVARLPGGLFQRLARA